MPSVSFDRFRGEVLEIYQFKAPATQTKMRQVLREFGELPGLRKTSDIRPVTLARWLKTHEWRAPATKASLLRSFRSACSVGVASGYLRSTPFSVAIRIEPRAGVADDPEPKRRHHSMEAIRGVLELVTSEARATPDAWTWKRARLEALVYICAFAALRKLEALRLLWDDVDLRRGIIYVRPNGRALKTAASAAPIPMAPRLTEILTRWEKEAESRWVIPNVGRLGPWTGGPPGHKPLDQVRALGRRAGVEGLTMLSFRHSFGTHAMAWGMGEMMLRQILRHTTVRTQKHYRHDDLENLREAIAAVSFQMERPAIN